MKCFLVITFFLSAISLSFGQGDTIINNRTYSILEKHSNGKAKYIGQFSTTCLDDTVRKHGFFIRFDTEGKEIGKKLYFFDEERNRKTLGLKHGWWGWYGRTEKYFMGIRTTNPVIVDPCF